jgi:hypothetical protein
MSSAAVSLAAVLGSGALAYGAPTHKVPRRDSFSGHITAATGSYAGDSGRLRIVLRPGRRTGTTRHLTVSLAGAPCRQAPHCVRLSGKLRGTLTELPSNPDVGKRFAIDADGKVKPAGQVAARGRVNGTGFIAYARETLRLSLRAGSSEITIGASSKRVRGFTSP